MFNKTNQNVQVNKLIKSLQLNVLLIETHKFTFIFGTKQPKKTLLNGIISSFEFRAKTCPQDKLYSIIHSQIMLKCLSHQR